MKYEKSQMTWLGCALTMQCKYAIILSQMKIIITTNSNKFLAKAVVFFSYALTGNSQNRTGLNDIKSRYT